MSAHRDPADIAKERTQRARELIAKAEAGEARAFDEREKGNGEGAAALLTWANNWRMQAMCIHLRLPIPAMEPIDGETQQ